MEASVSSVSAEKKEATAITVMRCMLVHYAEEKQIPFEQALLQFTQSRTYEDLFETEVWKEAQITSDVFMIRNWEQLQRLSITPRLNPSLVSSQEKSPTT